MGFPRPFSKAFVAVLMVVSTCAAARAQVTCMPGQSTYVYESRGSEMRRISFRCTCFLSVLKRLGILASCPCPVGSSLLTALRPASLCSTPAAPAWSWCKYKFCCRMIVCWRMAMCECFSILFFFPFLLAHSMLEQKHPYYSHNLAC